jgi:hypothetical protein
MLGTSTTRQVRAPTHGLDRDAPLKGPTVPLRDEFTPAEDLLAVVTAAAEAHVVAAKGLVEELDRNCEFTREVLEAISSGRPLVEAMHANRSFEVRPAQSTAIRLFENARHRLRLHLVRVAIAEGATDAEICELWSFSNEMVRRIKKEIAELEEAGVPIASPD